MTTQEIAAAQGLPKTVDSSWPREASVKKAGDFKVSFTKADFVRDLEAVALDLQWLGFTTALQNCVADKKWQGALAKARVEAKLLSLLSGEFSMASEREIGPKSEAQIKALETARAIRDWFYANSKMPQGSKEEKEAKMKRADEFVKGGLESIANFYAKAGHSQLGVETVKGLSTQIDTVVKTKLKAQEKGAVDLDL